MRTSSAPFDHFATDYDLRFSDRLAANWLRSSVYQHVAPLIDNETAVVELGCGTGEDALWFAQRGCRVWATDASSAMLNQARDKIARLDVDSRISLQQIDLMAWQPTDLPAGFTPGLVFSNFGALNCIHDLEPVFRTAWQCLEDGGFMAVSLMGRFCLSETLYFGLHGQFVRASRRWRGQSRYTAGGDEHLVWYHSPAKVSSSADGFRRVGMHGIGGLLPPSEGFGLCERWPRLFSYLASWDRRLSRQLGLISDHYLMILQKEG